MTRFLLTFAVLSVVPCGAEVRLPKVVASHMVLQQRSSVRIWGWADPGEMVSVSGDWLSSPVTSRAGERGQWQVSVRTGAAGGPHELTIAGSNTIRLEDILFGEVWLASGQSNMEMPLVGVSGAYTGIRDAKREVAEADHPTIRLFQAGNFSSNKALDDVEPGISMYGIPPAACRWQPCTPETIPTFASTAYFFARELQRRLDVPIGIIDASWGGTSAETWMPKSGLQKLGYAAELEQAATRPQKSDQKVPTRLYNGMINPLRKLRIRGVIWYQGEGNAGCADKYQELFSAMIVKWRAIFGSEFSFYFVQIAPYRYGNVNAAYLREAQLKTLSVPRTGMVVTMDIGNLTDIHPRNKQEVGRRLALWALARDYGKSLVHSGPLYKAAKFEAGQARISFDHTGAGLTTADGDPPSHFEIAGADKVFHPATATIDGAEVLVASDKVAAPAAVRYAFSSEATPNLTNRDGLPASPFRTDDWVN